MKRDWPEADKLVMDRIEEYRLFLEEVAKQWDEYREQKKKDEITRLQMEIDKAYIDMQATTLYSQILMPYQVPSYLWNIRGE